MTKPTLVDEDLDAELPPFWVEIPPWKGCSPPSSPQAPSPGRPPSPGPTRSPSPQSTSSRSSSTSSSSTHSSQDGEGETDTDLTPPPSPLTPREQAIQARLAERKRQILTVRQAFFPGSPFDDSRERHFFAAITRCPALVPDLFIASELDLFGTDWGHGVYARSSNPVTRDEGGAWACVEMGWPSELARKYYILYDEWVRHELERARPPHVRRVALDSFPVPRRLWPITPPEDQRGVYRFMIPPNSEASVVALPDPEVDGSLDPIDELMVEYSAVLLSTNPRLRGAEECVLSARL